MADEIDYRSWEEFRESGLLWWVNRMLHLFGWAIVLHQRTVFGPDCTKEVYDAYPARCKFRGFTEDADESGFKRLTTYMKDNASSLMADLAVEQKTPPP